MALLWCGRKFLSRLSRALVCSRASAAHTLPHTHSAARGFRDLSKSRPLASARFGQTDGSDAAPAARGSAPQQQHGGAVFNLDVLVSVLREENAADICVIRVPEEFKYTEYFIIVSGSSTRHLRAMTQYTNKVYKFLRRDGDPHTRVEGQDCDDWMCIDFGSMVVHFMLPETRERFQLETLWTLRRYEQLTNTTLPHTLPPDFILTHTHTAS